jgi:precorrin-8X/cobalt-precorrin-8 methylmutase
MTMTDRLFDRIVVVRWSAADAPTRGFDSIWRASIDVDSGELDCVNHATRTHAEKAITDELLSVPHERVFLGVDFPLGYPAGFAGRLASGANWRATWTSIASEVVDGVDNDDNRWEAASNLNGRAGMSPGPFWGSPAGVTLPSLTGDRPRTYFGLAEWRATEDRLHARGLDPVPVWQLAGEVPVGSRSLLGIPALRRLAEHRELARRVRVWPFETGCHPMPTMATPAAIVVGEVRDVAFDLDHQRSAVEDAAGSIGTATHLAELDRRGELGALFAPDLDREAMTVVEREEGWILGA